MLRAFRESRANRIFLLIFLFGVVLRLFSITNPLLDQHAWRQSSCGIVARNYLSDMDLFRPKVDMVGMPYPPAFSFYEYYVALLAKLFGFSVVLGRSVTLFVSLLGFVYFYRLVKRYWGEQTALWASAFYAFLPTSAYYARSFQADGGMVALTVVFIFYFARWVDENRWRDYLLSIVAAFFMISFKLPSLYMFLAATAYLFLVRGWRFIGDWRYYAFVAASSAFPLLYYHLVPVLSADVYSGSISKTYHLADLSFLASFRYWYKTFLPGGNLWEYQFVHTGYILMVLGIFKKVQDRRQWLFYFWMGSVFLFFMAAAYAMHHEYYSLPLIPVACVFIGRFLADFFGSHKWITGQKLVYGLVSFMVLYAFVFSLCRLWDRCRITEIAHYIPMAEVIRKNTQPGDLVLYSTKGFEELQFLAHRKGFHISRPLLIEEAARGDGTLGAPAFDYRVLAIADYDIAEKAPAFYAALRRKYELLYAAPKAYVFRIPSAAQNPPRTADRR